MAGKEENLDRGATLAVVPLSLLFVWGVRSLNDRDEGGARISLAELSFQATLRGEFDAVLLWDALLAVAAAPRLERRRDAEAVAGLIRGLLIDLALGCESCAFCSFKRCCWEL